MRYAHWSRSRTDSDAARTCGHRTARVMPIHRLRLSAALDDVLVLWPPAYLGVLGCSVFELRLGVDHWKEGPACVEIPASGLNPLLKIGRFVPSRAFIIDSSCASQTG